MQTIFKPRYPTSNAGFWFTAVSLALSFGLGALLVIGLMNNNQSNSGQAFNLGGALIVFVVAILLFILLLAVIYHIMKNQPKQVVVEDQQVLVQDARSHPPRLEAEIPFSELTLVRVADIPVEGGLFPASFEGLIFHWQPDAETSAKEYVLSSRNVRNFEELRLLVFARAPQAAQGARTYRL
jgi:hypothetical protein